MKFMEHVMNNRREHDTGKNKKDDSCEQRIQSSEPLSCCRMQLIDGAHTAQEHRGIQKGIRPGQAFNKMVNRHSNHQRTHAQWYYGHAMTQHSSNDMPWRRWV